MLDGASLLSVFTALERPVLLPLPAGSFVLARSVSPRSPRTAVFGAVAAHRAVTHVRVTDTVVQVRPRGELVKTWPRARPGRCTCPADYPPGKIAFFFSRNPVWCRTRATGLGRHLHELVDGLLAV